MKLIRHLDEISGTERDVFGRSWRSHRLIVAEDGLKYSFHVTVLEEGARLEFEYRDHPETACCIDGRGRIEDLSHGRAAELGPGSVYSAGIEEPHRITAATEMTLVCVFDPPLTGTEEAG